MAKIRKHRLTLKTPADHRIVAIASHEKGYHLAWTLNNNLGMHLVRAGEYTVTKKKQNIKQSFPLFRWDDETRMLTFHLVANRSESGILIEKLKNIDFFLHIAPPPETALLNLLTEQLNALPVIIASFPVAPEESPYLANMIFE